MKLEDLVGFGAGAAVGLLFGAGAGALVGGALGHPERGTEIGAAIGALAVGALVVKTGRDLERLGPAPARPGGGVPSDSQPNPFDLSHMWGMT